MSPTLTAILDLVLVALLGAVLVYAVLLNRQIIRLRESKGELSDLIRGLNEAMAKADSGVRGMRKAASEVGEGLRDTVVKAATLRDELSMIVETGESLADRLGSPGERSRGSGSGRAVSAPASRPALIDETLAAARAEASRRPSPQPSMDEEPLPPREEREGNLSRAERELMRAIENRR